MTDMVVSQVGAWWACDCVCHNKRKPCLFNDDNCNCCIKCPKCLLHIAGNFQMHLDEAHARVASS